MKAYKFLTDERMEFVLSKQLLRSSTSIGANLEEAVAVGSKAGFVHKLNISAKEAGEISYWLGLLKIASIFRDQHFYPYWKNGRNQEDSQQYSYGFKIQSLSSLLLRP